MEVLHNAFIKAILLGFDRAVRPNAATHTRRQSIYRGVTTALPPLAHESL